MQGIILADFSVQFLTHGLKCNRFRAFGILFNGFEMRQYAFGIGGGRIGVAENETVS